MHNNNYYSPPHVVAKGAVEQTPRRVPLALVDALVIALRAAAQLCRAARRVRAERPASQNRTNYLSGSIQ